MDSGRLLYKAGDVIQDWAKPFAKILLDSEKEKRCMHCFNESQEGTKLLRCASCKTAHYCNKQCQRDDWKFAHSVECKMLLFRVPLGPAGGPTSCLRSIVTRTLAHLQKHPGKEFEERRIYDGRGSRSFSTLVAHVHDGDDAMDDFAKLISTYMIRENPKWSAEFIRKILGIWKVNSFEVTDKVGNKIGEALCIEAAVFDHSCRPNALSTHNKEWSNQVRAIADIPLGEQPLITYLPGLLTRPERQLHLKRVYNFECSCALCEEEKGGNAATNYEVLIDFRENSVAVLTMTALAKGSTFETVVELRDKVVQLYRGLYHPYDERITVVTTIVFKFCVEYYFTMGLGKIGSGDSVQALADDTLKRIEISFGKGHVEYGKVKDCMISLGLKVAE